MNRVNFLAWRGPSPLTGDEIGVVCTAGSTNEKTGPMVQVWVLVWDVSPFEAVKSNRDAAICGGCRRRGTGGGAERTCYVSLFNGPIKIWRAMRAGRYPSLTLTEGADRLAGRHVRVTAYGDPVVLPFLFWKRLLAKAAGWAGYTHLWQLADPAFRELLMASADTPDEAALAGLRGWRVYRARRADEPARPWELICPASDEGGHRTTCVQCQLCRGTSSPAKPIVIIEHGRHTHRSRGRAGKYVGLRRQLDAGHPVVLDVSRRDAGRVVLAMRQAYFRRGESRRLRQQRLPDGRTRLDLVAR